MIVGIYGPIGSGKTKLAINNAVEHNFEFVSLDDIAKELLATNQQLIDELKKDSLGKNVVVNNQVNNKMMTKYIFGSFETNNELSKIIWPYVKAEAEKIIKQANEQKKDIILEAATLPALEINGIDHYVYVTRKYNLFTLFKVAKAKHKSVFQIMRILKIQKRYNMPFIPNSVVIEIGSK